MGERLKATDTSQKAIKHKKICEELMELYKRKNHDYGDSFHQLYEEYGIAAVGIRLSDKLNRFKQLSTGKTQKVNDESIRDTLMDLENYSIMALMEME